MSQLRKFRDSISNYFDEIERGVGKRGSTFSDVDAVSHDMETRRFLFREFKEDGELLDKAQMWILRDLAKLPRCTVWVVRRNGDGVILFEHEPYSVGVAIGVDEYRARLSAWWQNTTFTASTPAPVATPVLADRAPKPSLEFAGVASKVTHQLTADDIFRKT